MTDTPASTELVTFGEELDPARRRHLAAQYREAKLMATAPNVPSSIKLEKGQPRPAHEVVALLFEVIRYGELFGYPPAVALAKVDVIEGRLEPRYDALLGLLRHAGHELRKVHDECTDTIAHVKVRRVEDRDDPDPDVWQHFTFTIEQAERAGLTGKDNWKKYPADMLISKATKRAVRFACPDVLVVAGHDASIIEGVPFGTFEADETVVDAEVVE